jgi:hypothetical protein
MLYPSVFLRLTCRPLRKAIDASHAVAPSSGYNPFGPPEWPFLTKWLIRQLPWSFFPLRRINPGESTCPWLASPSTVRPQSFSLSRRFTPLRDVQPCFMLVTPLGFRPSGFLSHRQVPAVIPQKIPSWCFFLCTQLENILGCEASFSAIPVD